MTLSKEVPALSKLQTRFSLESPYHYNTYHMYHFIQVNSILLVLSELFDNIPQ